MCEFVCVICTIACPLGLIIAAYDLMGKKVKHYCHKGKQHQWGEWNNYLEGRDRKCSRCGITECE